MILKPKKIVLFDIDYTLFDTGHFKRTRLQEFSVYKNVHTTLAKLSQLADLGIFSEGNIAFQYKKLQETQIEKYFQKEHIHIVEDKINAIRFLVEKYNYGNKVYLVDDRLPIFPLLKKEFPTLFTILMCQKSDYAFYQEPIEGFAPDATVEHLDEVIPFIINT